MGLEDPCTIWAWILSFPKLLCSFILLFLTGPSWFIMCSLSYWAEFPFLLGPKPSLLFPKSWAFFMSTGLASRHILDLNNSFLQNKQVWELFYWSFSNSILNIFFKKKENSSVVLFNNRKIKDNQTRNVWRNGLHLD